MGKKDNKKFKRKKVLKKNKYFSTTIVHLKQNIKSQKNQQKLNDKIRKDALNIVNNTIKKIFSNSLKIKLDNILIIVTKKRGFRVKNKNK